MFQLVGLRSKEFVAWWWLVIFDLLQLAYANQRGCQGAVSCPVSFRAGSHNDGHFFPSRLFNLRLFNSIIGAQNLELLNPDYVEERTVKLSIPTYSVYAILHKRL